LSILAENNQLVQRLFVEKNINSYGYYKIKLCIQGFWREIILDDYFPCHPLDKPVFITSS